MTVTKNKIREFAVKKQSSVLGGTFLINITLQMH